MCKHAAHAVMFVHLKGAFILHHSSSGWGQCIIHVQSWLQQIPRSLTSSCRSRCKIAAILPYSCSFCSSASASDKRRLQCTRVCRSSPSQVLFQCTSPDLGEKSPTMKQPVRFSEKFGSLAAMTAFWLEANHFENWPTCSRARVRLGQRLESLR